MKRLFDFEFEIIDWIWAQKSYPRFEKFLEKKMAQKSAKLNDADEFQLRKLVSKL